MSRYISPLRLVLSLRICFNLGEVLFRRELVASDPEFVFDGVLCVWYRRGGHRGYIHREWPLRTSPSTVARRSAYL